MPDMIDKIRCWSYRRQFLGKKGENIEHVLKSIAGVYSAHPSGPLSLYARVSVFDENSFYKLDTHKLAYRVPAMRHSVYILPAETAHLAMAATIPAASDPAWEKRYSQKGKEIPKYHYGEWQQQIFRITDQPLTFAEIKKEVDIPGDILKPVLNRMAFERHLLRIGAPSLRSNTIRYVSTKAWTNNYFRETDIDEAQNWLAGEYLKAFGPARVKDFQWWAGVTSVRAKKALSEIDTVSIDDGYLLLNQDTAEFETFKPAWNDSLDLLPRWDTYTMGYAPDGRERFVSPDMQHNIYGKIGATGGNAMGVVLVNGAAHGAWDSRFAGTKMNISVRMFEKPSQKLISHIEDQFNKLGVLLKAKKVQLEVK